MRPVDSAAPESLSWGAVERLTPGPPEAHRPIWSLRAEIDRLRLERDQLETALESRIVIEQAKGMLAERLQMSPAEAFDVLRLAARSSRRKLRELAAEIVHSQRTPPEIEAALARRRRAR